MCFRTRGRFTAEAQRSPRERRANKWLAVLLLAFSVAAPGQRFLPDDPVERDRDDRNIPAPRRHKLSDYYDFIQNSFGSPGDRKPRTAVNINTLGEAPDSTWFTNRHGRRRMSIEELVKGPDRGAGPAEGALVIRRGKNEGITPGFSLVEDSRGDRYALKFDPTGNLEMTTSADVIGAKFFHAMGFNVPENYIFYFRPEELELAEDATISDDLGRRRKMDRVDLQQVLSRVARVGDGRYRVVASKILPGEDLGPFRYYGTRPDDPNDIFPHEHRRELRGLWVLSAWLNHDDSRAINSLDMLVKEEGRQFVRHHLIDFGSILGSGSDVEQKPRAGNEYLWEPGPAFTRMLTLGLWDRGWIATRYRRYPSLGRIEADHFAPEKWKPEYPNPAFVNCLPEDAYWGAKIVMAFTDEDIRAIVKTGRITDPWAEEYLVQVILKRRDRVVQHWLAQISALDRFEIQGDRLKFVDLAVERGVLARPAAYTATWYRYDNERDRKTVLDSPILDARSPLPIPAPALGGSQGSYYSVQIRRAREKDGKIPKAAHVYFRKAGARLQIVGIEREE